MPTPATKSIKTVIGVDFSGAKLAGRNIWLARCSVARGSLRLQSLDRLEDLAGAADRERAYTCLLKEIDASDRALWGIDFPFGLPIELGLGDWSEQLALLSAWADTANEFGLHCCDCAKQRVQRLHTRRETDTQTKTPFDCYHYRIIYQTFHGMRDVLLPLVNKPETCVLPFNFDALERCRRIVVEACPGSTLKRLGLPHNRYKQTKPGKVAAKYVRVRKTILEGLADKIELDGGAIRTMLSNPGGDALDAVIAAVGVWDAWKRLDVEFVRSHPRYVREGLVFC